MDKNNPNKKPKPNQRVAESNVKHEHLLWEGIENGVATDDNVATTTFSIEQPNTSKVDIRNAGERETRIRRKQSLYSKDRPYFCK